jgi:hypothetical protein
MKILTIHQKLGPKDCPYVIRYILNLYFFSIRLHIWLKSDDLRYEHDHPWDFYSFVLYGSLYDRSNSRDTYRPTFSCSFFKAEHKHSVVIDKPAITLLITGKERREWGYWVNDRFRK